LQRYFKTYWYGLQLPIHLIAFIPSSITKLLKSAGFDVKKIYYGRRSSTLKLSSPDLTYGKYRFLSKLSYFQVLINMVNVIPAMLGPCDVIVIHVREETSCDV
jgi:hypothetical protein